MKLQDTQLQLSSAIRPSTDGQSEVTNKFVNKYIQYSVAPYHDAWDILLPLCEFAYNSRVDSTIGMSPFMTDLGFQPHAVSDCAAHRASKFVTHQNAISAGTVTQDRWHTAYDCYRPKFAYAARGKVVLSTKDPTWHILAWMGSASSRQG